jgi:hypothetical protein
MSEIKTTRPYKERLLDGFDRSELRREVQKVRPAKGLRKKYATWALASSLALGGLGIPLKMVQGSSSSMVPAGSAGKAESSLVDDLRAAQRIASQVAGGVQAAAAGVESVASGPVAAVVDAPRELAAISEGAKEKFFRTEVPFGSIIYNEAKKNDLDPSLVAAVVQAESRFKPTARSHRGAVGLMQLVPKTGRWMGARDLANPHQNVAAGAKYLRYLSDRFDGDQKKIIAAYNAGEGNVRRFGGVPPFRETQNYVNKVQDFQKDFGDRVESTVAALQTPEVIPSVIQ